MILCALRPRKINIICTYNFIYSWIDQAAALRHKLEYVSISKNVNPPVKEDLCLALSNEALKLTRVISNNFVVEPSIDKVEYDTLIALKRFKSAAQTAQLHIER